MLLVLDRMAFGGSLDGHWSLELYQLEIVLRQRKAKHGNQWNSLELFSFCITDLWGILERPEVFLDRDVSGQARWARVRLCMWCECMVLFAVALSMLIGSWFVVDCFQHSHEGPKCGGNFAKVGLELHALWRFLFSQCFWSCECSHRFLLRHSHLMEPSIRKLELVPKFFDWYFVHRLQA